MMADIEKIKVLIVDDHRVVRQGLRTFLDLNDDIQVVGEASDGQEAVNTDGQVDDHVRSEAMRLDFLDLDDTVHAVQLFRHLLGDLAAGDRVHEFDGGFAQDVDSRAEDQECH